MHEAAVSILSNTVVLLEAGLFPGHFAPAVSECRQFVQNLLNEAKAKDEAEKAAAKPEVQPDGQA